VIESATVRDLKALIGADHVLAPDQARRYGHDATASAGLRGSPDAVALPASAEEVASVVAWCYARDTPIVPRGAGTGLAGGATPTAGGVVVSLERLNAVRSFEPLLWRLQAEAGVRTATVRRLARENGLLFPVDPGAGEESHIGGNIATNAGGPHCFKYGTMRAWTTGVEVVLAPGELVRFGGPLRKDTAAYDLTGLMCGSEGTLGIVTAAWLRLTPSPNVQAPVCAFLPDGAAAAQALQAIMASGVTPSAIEYLDPATMRIAGRSFPAEIGTDPGFLIIAEVEGTDADRGELCDALERTVMTDPRALWRWREGVSHAVGAHRGGKLSEDIVVPLDRFADGVEGIIDIGRRHDLEACSWGHAGDGNLHGTFLLDPTDPVEQRRAAEAAESLFGLARALGGSVSGEHGLGVLKSGQLERQLGRAGAAAHEAVKRALDPKGLFNPGTKVAAGPVWRPAVAASEKS
jgi:FAD/FMN-containing dehydrogenase